MEQIVWKSGDPINKDPPFPLRSLGHHLREALLRVLGEIVSNMTPGLAPALDSPLICPRSSLLDRVTLPRRGATRSEQKKKKLMFPTVLPAAAVLRARLIRAPAAAGVLRFA